MVAESVFRTRFRQELGVHMTDLLASTPSTDASSEVVTVTPGALATVQAARADEVDAASLSLWLEVGAAPGGKFRYDMWFQRTDEAVSGDVVQTVADGFTVVVPAGSIAKLQGATLDMAADGSGMVLLNPNEPQPPVVRAAPQTDMNSPLALRVQAVLVEQVNPSIASHGGFAELVAVEADTVWLRMGGGCQGCAMSKATLRQGIEVAIKDAVAEIVHVIDVTDHESGANPFYS
jgi:Fe/S biogenesis protein NfuA